MWSAAIAGIVGTVVGIILGQILSAAREHRNWVNDHKLSEYRELLDLLYQTVTVVSENRPNLSQFNSDPVNVSVTKLSRAFADRIFVADALRQVNANEDWIEMKKVIYYDPELQAVTPKELWYTLGNLHSREDRLRNKILEQAKRDIVKFRFLAK